LVVSNSAADCLQRLVSELLLRVELDDTLYSLTRSLSVHWYQWWQPSVNRLKFLTCACWGADAEQHSDAEDNDDNDGSRTTAGGQLTACRRRRTCHDTFYCSRSNCVAMLMVAVQINEQQLKLTQN